jgi:peptidoglycan/xylan/chitin deacetylase (PgdA/CDA1 family)
MFADAACRGPAGARGIVLTFDDGPHPEHTRKILELLDESGAKATFFLIAKKAEAHADVEREIVARGHAVGLHSYAHDRLFSLRTPSRVKADLERGIGILREITGERPELFRPPIGHTTPAIARVADELDLSIVGWSVAGFDGVARAVPEEVVARVRAGLRDGAIVLLHDAAERDDREPAAVRALPGVLAAIADRGIPIVPLDPWV